MKVMFDNRVSIESFLSQILLFPNVKVQKDEFRRRTISIVNIETKYRSKYVCNYATEWNTMK